MKFLIVILSLMTYIHPSSTSDMIYGINFRHNTFEQVFEDARAEGKLVFIDCYTSWCGPCKQMDRTVFQNAQVARYMNRHFVNVKVDMDTPFGKEMARKARVNSYPTLLFVDTNANIIQRKVGYRDSRSFLQIAEQVRRGY